MSATTDVCPECYQFDCECVSHETPLCGCYYCRTYCQCVEHLRQRQQRDALYAYIDRINEEAGDR